VHTRGRGGPGIDGAWKAVGGVDGWDWPAGVVGEWGGAVWAPHDSSTNGDGGVGCGTLPPVTTTVAAGGRRGIFLTGETTRTRGSPTPLGSCPGGINFKIARHIKSCGTCMEY